MLATAKGYDYILIVFVKHEKLACRLLSAVHVDIQYLNCCNMNELIN